jgi:hypothetical protein
MKKSYRKSYSKRKGSRKISRTKSKRKGSRKGSSICKGLNSTNCNQKRNCIQINDKLGRSYCRKRIGKIKKIVQQIFPQNAKEINNIISNEVKIENIEPIITKAEILRTKANDCDKKGMQYNVELNECIQLNKNDNLNSLIKELKEKVHNCRTKGLKYNKEADKCIEKIEYIADLSNQLRQTMDEGQQYETKAQTLARKAQECRIKGMKYNTKLNQCVDQIKAEKIEYELQDILDKGRQYESEAQILARKAQECKLLGLEYDSRLNTCIQQFKISCRNDEFDNNGVCSKYSSLRSFDEDDCDEDNNQVFDWRRMRCADAATVNEEENEMYEEKYNKWNESQQVEPEMERPLIMQRDEDIFSQIRKGKQLRKTENQISKQLIEDCEKNPRKMYHRNKGCIDRKLSPNELKSIEALERAEKYAQEKAAKSDLESGSDDDWDD